MVRGRRRSTHGRGFHFQRLSGPPTDARKRERPPKVKHTSVPLWRVYIDRRPNELGMKDLPSIDVEAGSDEAAAWRVMDEMGVPGEYIVEVERVRNA